MPDLSLRRAVAEALLGYPLDPDGFAPCPGRALHTHRSGRRDFQVMLDGAPTGRCFHASCGAAVEEFNLSLRRAVAAAEADPARPRPPSMIGPGVPMPPEAPRPPRRPAYDPARLADLAARCPVAADAEWLAARSPVAVPPAERQGPATAADFLEALYRPGERVLVFVREYSQADFLFEIGRGCFRLAEAPGVRAVPSPLPDGGPFGVWFLTAPVVGDWRPNPNNRDEIGRVRLGRRHGDCVTRWPFLVLENDEAAPEAWLRALVQLPLPLAAAYTSGGRSIHALVAVDAASKAEFDLLRDALLPVVCPLGADAAAMSGVRLSRLPGCLRHGKRDAAGRLERYPAPRLQRLLWLNPEAPAKPILDLVKH